MSKLKVIMCCGLPASGKTTWSKEMVEKSRGQYKRVSKDDLRAMLDNSKWSKANEKFVLDLRDKIILATLEQGKSIIVDDTNFAPRHKDHITQLVGDKAKVEIKFFYVDLEEAIKRDLKRLNSVGEKVIRDMYKTYLEPEEEQYKPDTKLLPAYIFDIDGTLALKQNRSPFDWDKVDQDEINQPVLNILNTLVEENTIIIFSGRDEICREKTETWLGKYCIYPTLLLMRKHGDMRKDSIVKMELFDEIKDKYNIKGVFDDRKQVVEMWRSIGLTCFQVAEGDF
jgi:predicted kinase